MDPILFSSMVEQKNIPDEKIETVFYIFFTEANTEEKIAALDSLKKHRPKVAQIVSQELVSQTSDELMEEAIDCLAKNEDEKKLAFCIISIWDIHPELAERMDIKYSLGIKAIMDESKSQEIYE